LLVPSDVESMLTTLERLGPAPRFSQEERDALLAGTLTAAYRACVERMGGDTTTWSWGRLHQLRLDHPLGARLPAAGIPAPDVGPLPLGGSESTLMKAAYRPSDGRVTMGASMRMVVDVGDWDRSVWINMPGQSGDPRSPHYGDLSPLWERGEYVPMAY